MTLPSFNFSPPERSNHRPGQFMRSCVLQSTMWKGRNLNVDLSLDQHADKCRLEIVYSSSHYIPEACKWNHQMHGGEILDHLVQYEPSVPAGRAISSRAKVSGPIQKATDWSKGKVVKDNTGHTLMAHLDHLSSLALRIVLRRLLALCVGFARGLVVYLVFPRFGRFPAASVLAFTFAWAGP